MKKCYFFAEWLWIFVFWCLCVGFCLCRKKEWQPPMMGATVSPQKDAMHRLLHVFGLQQPGKRERHHTPPQYMLDLYSTIADNEGITRTQKPYDANIVRSFHDTEWSRHRHFHFNITGNINPNEKILEAEFHVYKMKPRHKAIDRYKNSRSQLLEVRVYQILSPHFRYKQQSSNRLLDVRRMSIHSIGWEVFYVKQAVLDWIRDPAKNFGFLITIQNLLGENIETNVFRFAKRKHHSSNKQSILVVFSDDRRTIHQATSPTPKYSHHDYGFPELSPVTRVVASEKSDLNSKNFSSAEDSKAQSRRSLDGILTSSSGAEVGLLGLPSTGCSRHELYVDFEKIGWSTWIISPKGYNAYYCKGECMFPLGQNQWPTNHATVQSIIHELSLTPGVGTPCCVPNKLYSISLLYFDEHENVILKQYDDMVAASCGCQ